MDVRAINRKRWDRQVELGNEWTRPVGPDVIARARSGDWTVRLTEQIPVPRDWFPPLEGLSILCLASGGGQQGPTFAAAGACVTVYDNSPKQLEQDRLVGEREGLQIATVEGDMRDLGALAADSFDLVFHPVSNVFVPEVRPVWNEAYRVLRPGGVLMAGFMNPAIYLFDFGDPDEQPRAKYPLPFDSRDLSEDERLEIFGEDGPLEFSHSLTDLLGGQIEAGFVLTHLYEDQISDKIARLMPAYIATRAIAAKPSFG